MGGVGDARAVRAGLPVSLVGDFDREWDLVLDRAKRDKDLGPVLDLLSKWRHVAQAETAEPGSWQRLLVKAEEIQRSGINPDAASIEDLRAVIDRRLA